MAFESFFKSGDNLMNEAPINAASKFPAEVIVSVAMVTYNHERFIAQAIEGVLMQQTNFVVELVIGEDCSTDGTRAVVRAYGEHYPERIRLLLHERNQGAHANFIATLAACRGQYVAYCEGDDYWTDPLKLQKQVDFLESHSECSMCFHEANNLWPDGYQELYIKSQGVPIKERYFLEDLFDGGFIPSASMVIRRDLILNFPKEANDISSFDWFLHILLAEQGALAYLDEVWSVRRIHKGGIASMIPFELNAIRNIKSMLIVDKYLKKNYREINLRKRALSALSSLTAYTMSDNNLNFFDYKKNKLALSKYSSTISLSCLEKYHVLCNALLELVFIYKKNNQISDLRVAWIYILVLNPLISIRNKGFLSIGIEVLLGKKFGNALRKRYRELQCR